MARNQPFPKKPTWTGQAAAPAWKPFRRRKKRTPAEAGGLLYRRWQGAYSALPPNLCVYCRLIVRPTLSNQDTS